MPSRGSPAPTRRTREKKARDRLIGLAATHPDWVLGFADETWWSRLALPRLHAWTADEPLRLIEREVPRGTPTRRRQAATGCSAATPEGCCCGSSPDDREQVTEDFLDWACGVLAAEGKKALLLVWDNLLARQSAGAELDQVHNGRAKRGGCADRGVPVAGEEVPWLNPIEPKWAHGKRVAEPERMTPDGLQEVRIGSVNTTAVSKHWPHANKGRLILH